MKAVLIEEYGDAGKLQIATVARPVISADQLLIRVICAGINPVDTKIRSGSHVSVKDLRLPVILGKDFSGVVEEAGAHVKEFQVGDAVFGLASQTYSEFIAVEPSQVVKKPENLSFEEAAGLPLAGLTAYQAINTHLQVSSGRSILIQSAAGGVGHLATQFASLLGARVSGTSSARNLAFIKMLGVENPIDYKTERFEDKVSALDFALDSMGGEVLYRTIQCLAPGGKLVCLPSSTKNDPKALECAKAMNIELSWMMMTFKSDQLYIIRDLAAEEMLKIHISKVYPMEEVIKAHQEIESHGVRGKLVLRIGQEMPLKKQA